MGDVRGPVVLAASKMVTMCGWLRRPAGLGFAEELGRGLLELAPVELDRQRDGLERHLGGLITRSRAR